MINLNGTTPAAPTGTQNVSWQNDGSGNVSANFPIAPTKISVSPASGTLTLNCALASSFFVNISTAITTVNITNPVDGQEITILWAQGATAYSVTLPTNLLGATAVTTTANQHTCQKFTYNLANGNWYAIPSTNV